MGSDKGRKNHLATIGSDFAFAAGKQPRNSEYFIRRCADTMNSPFGWARRLVVKAVPSLRRAGSYENDYRECAD